MPCKLELAEEKSELAQLGQQNGFGPAFLHNLFEASKKAQQSLTPAIHLAT